VFQENSVIAVPMNKVGVILHDLCSLLRYEFSAAAEQVKGSDTVFPSLTLDSCLRCPIPYQLYLSTVGVCSANWQLIDEMGSKLHVAKNLFGDVHQSIRDPFGTSMSAY